MRSRDKTFFLVATTVAALAAAPAGCGDDGDSSGAGANSVAGSGGSGGSGATAGSGGDAGGGDTGGGGTAGGGGAPANEGSPLGTNLSGVRDWSREWAFVDAFKASRDWISGDGNAWDNGWPVDVDADGWVQSLAPGQIVRTLMFWSMDDLYPAGRYVVLYDGQGTIAYWSAATLDAGASSPGRDVIDVDPTQGGIGMNITAIDAGDHLRNIRVIMPGGACSDDAFRHCDDASPCSTGDCEPFEQSYAEQIFHPTFLDRVKTYSTLRFMDWMDTNNSAQQSWSGRPKLSDARWSTHGVPAEILVELSNRLSADPWLTVPHLADDGYVTQLATLVFDRLDPERRIYVEHSNEVWNGMFSQAGYAEQQGLALGLSADPYQARLRYHSQRSIEIFQIWETVFGGTSRLIRVMGSQAASTWVSEQVLDFQAAADDTDALGIAPYFGGYLGSPNQQAQVETMTIDELFAELETNGLPTAIGWITDQEQLATGRGVVLVAYEAGQHLAGNGGVENNDTVNALFDAANRDPRMGTLYASYLDGWKANGGQLLVHFVNCSGYSKWGRWGALEHLAQPRDEAPKFDALQSFIETETPWW